MYQSCSSGWGWPRRVSVEVDIEENRRRESHQDPREKKAEQSLPEEHPKSKLPSSSSEYTVAPQEDKTPIQKQTDYSGERDPEAPVEQKPHERRDSSIQHDHDSSQRQSPDLYHASPTGSDGFQHSHGVDSAAEFPMSEPSHSPAVKVRAASAGSSNLGKTVRRSGSDAGDRTMEQEDGADKTDKSKDQTLQSDQVQRNLPLEKEPQLSKVQDPTSETKTQLHPTRTITDRYPEPNGRLSIFGSKGSLRSTISGDEGKPHDLFPGADHSSEDLSSPLEGQHRTDKQAKASKSPHAMDSQSAETESAKAYALHKVDSPDRFGTDSKTSTKLLPLVPQNTTTSASDREHFTEPASAEAESNEPYVTFDGGGPHKRVTKPEELSGFLPQEQATTEQAKGDGEQSVTKPYRLKRSDPNVSSQAPGLVKAEHVRRPSRDSLQTRNRKPSVYMPLSKVPEAKGRMESANVQSPRQAIIVNEEEILNAKDSYKAGETRSDLHEATGNDDPKVTFLDYGELHSDAATTTTHKDSASGLPSAPTNAAESVAISAGHESIPLSSESRAAENVHFPEEPGRKVGFSDERPTTTPSPVSEASEEDALTSRRGSVVRKKPTPDEFMQRINTLNERLVPDVPAKNRKSSRRSTKMSLPPPRIVVQSPSSASELPEPLPTPAAPIPADEYKIKTRSGTIVSVQHTVHGAADRLSQSPPKKSKLYLRKIRNMAARRVILNATLGRQMGGRTKKKLRQLAKGEQLSSSPIPAPKNAPDLPPLRNRKSFILKARNLAARQVFLDATLGRQVAAETKPVLRHMASGKMVVDRSGVRL